MANSFLTRTRPDMNRSALNKVLPWVACAVLTLLAACTSGVKGKGADAPASHAASNTTSAAPSDTQLTAVSKPTDPNDTRAWAFYLGQIVRENTAGTKSDHLYPYLVPAGNSEDANGLRQRQFELVHGIVACGVPAGVTLVFAGPDSGKTAEFVTEVFKDVQADSLKDVIVLVVGDAADREKVTSAVRRTGATVRYANM